MKSRIYKLLFLVLIFLDGGGYYSQVLKGVVLNSDTKIGVPDAYIYSFDLEIGNSTNEKGNFEILQFPKYKSKILISAYGYEDQSMFISSDSIITILMEPKHAMLDEFVVATPTGKLQGENITYVTTVKLNEPASINNNTIGEVLTNVPGVYVASVGRGISKPVIRGLSGNRVVTYLDGLRIENQQWGGDHGVGVTALGIDRLEIIKGPSSSLYGSDAIGGVLYYVEAQYAKKIAKHLGTDHTELYVSSKEAMDVIPKLPIIYDEPFSDSSQIPTFLVSQLAKKHVTVALSGDGGDELFCGYNRYIISEKFWNIFNLIPQTFRKILASGLQSISSQNWTKISKLLPRLNKYSNFGDKIHKGANALKAHTSHELYYLLCSHWQNPTETVINSKEPSTFLTKFKPELKGLNRQQQMMVLDFITYLPDDILVKVDRAAMASSLEIRIPFLDHKLIEYVWKISHSHKFKKGQGKWILKKILSKYVPNNLTERPKMGFGIPVDSWLCGPLKDWAENLLDQTRLQQEGYFETKLIREKWKEHLSGKRNWQYDLWSILMFQAWLDQNN